MSWRVRALAVLLATASGAPADEFMPANLPSRSAALGGSSVADPLGAAAAQENLAGLSLPGNSLWVRYQSVALNLPAPDLGQGAMDLKWNALPGLGFGLLWQHLSSSALAKDRLRLGLGVDLGTWAGIKGLSVGLGLDRLEQQFSLDPAFSYGGLATTRAQAYDASAGLLWGPCPWFSFGLAADQLTRPNLGLVAPDVFNPVVHWDGGFHVPLPWGALYLHLGQRWNDEGPTQQEGVEWTSPGGLLALRAGGDGPTAALGAGFRVGDLHLDYVYRLGLSAQALAFGGGQGVDLGLDFGAPRGGRAAPAPAPTRSPSPAPTPVPTPVPTADPAQAQVSRAVALWNGGHRRAALAAVGAAVRGRPDMATAAALRAAWRAALATPTPRPTPPGEIAAKLAEAQAFRLAGRDDLARATLRSILRKKGGRAAAQAALRAMDRAPRDAAARARSRLLFRQGLRLYEQGRVPEALRSWDRALALDPGNQEALNSLTRARAQEGTSP